MGRLTGVLGGTFDPPHIGHLILAEIATDTLNLDRVLFVPAGDPPHKAAQTSIVHRVAMVEAAIRDNAHFALSRVDTERPGPHYSVDMLRLLRQKLRGRELFFLIGGDSLHDLPTWHDPAGLIVQARLGVLRRPDATFDLAELEAQIPGLERQITFIDGPMISISATLLRTRAQKGLSLRYLVPDAVAAYITAQKLYAK
ncbi:MAG TPA: nicotinate-nucleotide adenylyltransferase [Aggregatilineales bacterium]|nr:nicotinate-nucleotide adenylyltransferase [Aggregatilineales bacterium]